jgi:ribosomal protein S18 acetylase RimI-like enzyme
VIRRAEAADLEWIARIQQASPAASQWEPAEYLAYDCWVVTDGFLVTRSVASDEHEILNLVVAPEARRQGLAHELLTHALAQAAGSWFLEVRASNTAAIRLYEKLGFVTEARRVRYYHDGEDALVLRKPA